MVTRTRSITACLLALGLAVGCSSLGPPTETLSSAELSLRKAEEEHASRYAPLDLVQAREKLELAESASDDEHYREARRLAEQALVDAQLAEEKARSARAQETALEMRRSIETLRAETERYSPRSGIESEYPPGLGTVSEEGVR